METTIRMRPLVNSCWLRVRRAMVKAAARVMIQVARMGQRKRW